MELVDVDSVCVGHLSADWVAVGVVFDEVVALRICFAKHVVESGGFRQARSRRMLTAATAAAARIDVLTRPTTKHQPRRMFSVVGFFRLP